MSVTSPAPLDASASAIWSVGEVAAAVGLPASTLRTWERRYGLAPSVRTAGGHRRYDSADLERIRLMHNLVQQGISPAEAAKAAGRVHLTHAESGVAEVAWLDQVVAAARAFDSQRLTGLFAKVIREHGIATAWSDHLVHVLRRIGDEWASGNLGVESEHLVSESLLTVIRARLHELAKLPTQATILLAAAEEEQHALPILALQGALAESGVAAHALGPRLPTAALANIAARTRPKVVFLWASMPRSPHDRSLRVVAALATSCTVMLGGPGWYGINVPHATKCSDLATTVAQILERAA